MADESDGRSRVFAPGLLAGRAALVTGGGTGLGRATALELARCGAAVTIAGRREETLAAAVAEIRAVLGRDRGDGEDGEGGVGTDAADRTDAGDGESPGNRAVGAGSALASPGPVGWVAGDVREPALARQMVEAASERHGRLDFLINNAGGQYFTPAEGIVEKGWRAVWRLNVEGILNMSEAAAELGLGRAPGAGGADSAGGTIVNVTLSPHHGMPGMAHSGAARAAAEALTRELATRWAQRRIAVVAVAAGHFDTEVMVKYPASVRAGMARSVPLGRLGRPEEHAWLVALLCSPLGRALNGSTVTLDGARDNWFGPWPPSGLTGGTGEVPREARRPRGDAGGV